MRDAQRSRGEEAMRVLGSSTPEMWTGGGIAPPPGVRMLHDRV
jgi:hypothetical protein